MNRKPQTILHLSSTSGPGGAEMIVRRLAVSLDKTRFRSVVCLFRPGWLGDACREASLPTYVVGMNGAVDLHWFRDVADLLKKEQVAAIHAHEFTANTYGTALDIRCSPLNKVLPDRGEDVRCSATFRSHSCFVRFGRRDN